MNTVGMETYEIRIEPFHSGPRKRDLIKFAYKATNDEVFKCTAINTQFAMEQLKKWIKDKKLFDAPII